jgi:hypothetical protein
MQQIMIHPTFVRSAMITTRHAQHDKPTQPDGRTTASANATPASTMTMIDDLILWAIAIALIVIGVIAWRDR